MIDGDRRGARRSRGRRRARVRRRRGGTDDPPAPRPASAPARVDHFNSGRAWAELERQVELGPRPAGSRTLRRLARRLKRALPRGSFESVPGHPGLRNVVGRLRGAKPAVVVAAHYDTKRLPGFVGANDGAAGTAAVVELARALRRIDRPAGAPALRFVLFDGEEATDDSRPFSATGLRGSTAYAKRHARRGPRADTARLHRRQGPEHRARGELGPPPLEPVAGRREGRRRGRGVPARDR